MALRPEIRTPQTGKKRLGRGFTLSEVKEAGITRADARWMAIPIDTRRKTHHSENVAILKEYLARLKKLSKKTKRAQPKKRTVKPVVSKPIPEKIETDLVTLSGITKKTAEILVSAGVSNINDLSTISPRRLARLTGLKRDRTEKFVETAKQFQRDKARLARSVKVERPKITEVKHLPEMTRGDLKKLKDLGVATLDDLKIENPRDLSLLSGIPESRIKEWKKIIRSL